MNKGKVVDVKEKYAIVLNEDMAYEKIEKKGNLKVGKDIYYFEEDKYVKKQIPFKKYFLVAALFMIMFIQPLLNINDPYAYISIDINPSIQLEVDKEFKILDINALNSDAESIVDEKWIGKDAKLVIENIIEETEKKGILNDSRDFVLVSYYLTDKDKSSEEKLIKDFDEIFNKKQKKYEVAVVKSDDKAFEKSKEENTTIGKTVVNEKMKENISDLMNIKQKVKNDKDFKVYKKEIKENNKDKEDKIKNNKQKEEKIDKSDKLKDNKKDLKDKQKDIQENNKNDQNQRDKIKENKSKEEKDKIKENNSNKNKEEVNEKKNNKIKEKNKNTDKLRDKIKNNKKFNDKNKDIKLKENKSNNSNKDKNKF